MKKLFFISLIAFILVSTVSAIQFKVDYWTIQAKGGVGFPALESGNTLNAGFSGGISVRKGFDNELSAGAGLSIINMAYKIPGAPGPLTATILQLEGVYAPYLPDFIVWPYFKVGLGMWMVKYSSLSSASTAQLSEETTFGFQLGGGANYPLNNTFTLNAEVLFNQASLQGGTGDNYNFITFCVGVTMYLK